jgi:hypothetical protein
MKTVITLAVAFASAFTIASTASAQGAACDRACLLNTADAYVAALVAHDPSKAPMAPNAKFTEQSKVLKVGDEGLWKSAVAGPATFKIPVPDPVAGQIGVILMMKASAAAFPAGPARGNAPPPDPDAPADIQLALRLKVVDRKITEAEHVIARIAAPSQLNALKTPRAAFTQTVQRRPEPAASCGSSPTHATRSCWATASSPFADDCGRRENGMHTAGAGRPRCPASSGGFGGTPTGAPDS